MLWNGWRGASGKIYLSSGPAAARRRVRYGSVRAAQLLGAAKCALAVAPIGLAARGQAHLATVGVGYDGTPEAGEALPIAGSLARPAGARLRVRAVLHDRLPYIGWAAFARAERDAVQQLWDELIKPQAKSLREDTERVASASGAEAVVDVMVGTPSDGLIALSREVDLLVIGSRRWGPAGRALLGHTGEMLMHKGYCPMMVVPRPPRRRR